MLSKRIFLLTLYFAFSAFATKISAQTHASSLRIEITGARNNTGAILCSVYKEGKGYPDHPELAYYKTRVPIKGGRASIEIDSLLFGRYAVALLHDENQDNKMNTSSFGLPKEGYGFSNNVMGLFGPPSFSKASFVVPAGTQKKITIELRY